MNIYPTITTASQKSWSDKIKEIIKLGLKEVCVFPSMIDFKERKKLYHQLERSQIKHIPLVHLRHDFRPEEVSYFMVNYKTRHFNIHPQNKYPLQYDLSQYKKFIYLENARQKLSGNEIKSWAGLCLDFAHLEDVRLQQSNLFNHFSRLIKKNSVGCAHLSAIKTKPLFDTANNRPIYDSHYFQNLSEFDYLKRYRKILPTIAAIEIENPISEQLKIKTYLKKILK